MSRVVGGTKKAAPLKVAPGEFRPLTISPAMQAVMDRCQTPEQVGMGTRVNDLNQVADRCENWSRGRK